MYNYVWYFLIFSFLGWCLEVAFHAVKSGRFVNRGFVSGPACPIYGVGVCSVHLLLGSIKNIFLLFLAAAAVATLVELVVGFIMDKLFKSRWWDYSKEKFNFCGYVCPKFSLIWGLLCVGAVKAIDPLGTVVDRMHHPVWCVVAAFLVVLLFADAVMTSVKVFKFNHRLELLDKIASDVSSTLRIGSDFIGNGVYMGTTKLYTEYEKLLSQAAKLGVRIIDAFPTFRSKAYNDQIQEIRKRLEVLRSKKNDSNSANT